MDEPTEGSLLQMLHEKYKEEQKDAEFRIEEPVYRELIPKLRRQIQPGYAVIKPRALGSTAVVWVVQDLKLGPIRALKLPRPRLGNIANIVRIVRAEKDRLSGLNHQNIIKIFYSDEIALDIRKEKYSFPFFVMEYIDGVEDFDKFILKHFDSLPANALISYLADVLDGLAFLHRQGIMHCDLKPGNILLAPGRPALIADLGYAKNIPKIPSSGETEVSFTRKYAHPKLIEYVRQSSDPAANVAAVPRIELRREFDLFALGRTFQEVLSEIRKKESTIRSRNLESQSKFSPYQWLFLGYVAKRLLDGVIINRTGDELELDIIPGLSDTVMGELAYKSTEGALDDMQKLLHLYDLEGEIPELNPNLETVIQVAHCRVPATKRVKEVINHPTFVRLHQITQLGFISLVYPGAAHTRFEHVLGTFAHCCEYIRALWYDQANPLFQCIFSKRDLETILLASLLHDVSQYPMAHDLTEVASDFAHETFLLQLLHKKHPGIGESLARVVEGEWGIEVAEVLGVLNLAEDSSFRQRILHSIISGPLDCDKLDYLKRDSTHLGVSFGLSIDHSRLLRNLTVVHVTTETSVPGPSGTPMPTKKLSVVEIGITEKALVVAQSLLRARKDMFTQVYWQHTARALKAMLGFVVRGVLLRLTDENREEFWYAFWKFVSESLTDLRRPVRVEQALSNGHQGAILVGENIGVPSYLLSEDVGVDESTTSYASHLSASDDALLTFLWNYSRPSERQVISDIRARRLFRRLAVFSSSGDEGPEIYRAIYDRFRTYRLDGKFREIEDQRLKLEEGIIWCAVEAKGEGLRSTLERVNPLILVDIPVKAISRSDHDQKRELWYLPEDFVGTHAHRPTTFPMPRKSKVSLGEIDFDVEVGKIRVLAHWAWKDALEDGIDYNREAIRLLSL